MTDEIRIDELVEYFVKTRIIVKDKTSKKLYSYDKKSGIFKLLDNDDVKSMLQKFMRSGEYPDLVWNHGYFTKAVYHVSSIASMKDLNGIDEGLAVLHNGVFDANKTKLLPFKPDYKALSAADYDYNPKATCPVYDSFIESISCGDRTLMNTLNEVAGAVVFGYTKNEKAVILCGAGANGKSVFLDVLSELVGHDTVSSITIDELNSKRSFDRFGLNGCRLVCIHELGKNTSFSKIFDANVKKAISGQKIDAEEKYGKKIRFNPQFNIVMASNYFPEIDMDMTKSICRRFIILNFNRIFDENEQDEELFNKIRAEMPGVFNRAIEGYKRLRENKGYSAQADSDKYIEQQIAETHPVSMFASKCIIASADCWVSNRQIYETFMNWIKPMNPDYKIEQAGFSKLLNQALKRYHINHVCCTRNGDRGLKHIKIKET